MTEGKWRIYIDRFLLHTQTYIIPQESEWKRAGVATPVATAASGHSHACLQQAEMTAFGSCTFNWPAHGTPFYAPFFHNDCLFSGKGKFIICTRSGEELTTEGLVPHATCSRITPHTAAGRGHYVQWLTAQEGRLCATEKKEGRHIIYIYIYELRDK